MKTSELFEKGTVLSFEVFPPKPDSPQSTIYQALDELKSLRPDFISVTYGAGGGTNCAKTLEIASAVKNKHGIESVAHLAGVHLSKETVRGILDEFKQTGIENILALRGDIALGSAPGKDFTHADQLISFIRQNGDFNILAACYPEGHIESASVCEDVQNLKRKVDAGANQLITQLFLDNRYFYAFYERALQQGIRLPIQAGIMPVTGKKQIERMTKLCGVSLPKKFMTVIQRYENNPVALRDAGIAYAIDQIVDLLSQGVDGIHLYTMNKSYIAQKIHEAVYRLLAS